jgi:hypothetical protein
MTSRQFRNRDMGKQQLQGAFLVKPLIPLTSVFERLRKYSGTSHLLA